MEPTAPAAAAGYQVVFRSAHGDWALDARSGDSLIEICHRYGLPAGQMTAYLETADGLTLSVRPYDPVESYVGNSSLLLIPNRNIDYHALIGGSRTDRLREGASTWIRIRSADPDVEGGFVTEHLRPSDAMALVDDQVRSALVHCEAKDEPIVVGVSGGGDSNALLGSLVRSEIISPQNIHPVMMMGIPDWDDGWDRASSICAEHNLALRTITEGETAAILGFKDAEVDWVTRFERLFPGDDLEVLGVYAVRRVLEAIALEQDAQRIVVGNNLEDCLADALYYLCQGRVPFPKPLGRMGPVEIMYPLWLTPKSLIDGCYPKFSLENYTARYPSRSQGRAYFYYLAQMSVESYPGAGEDMVRGASALAADHFDGFANDEEFETATADPIPLDIRVQLRRLFGRPVLG